ncbi:hypothetical protein N7457_003539 [Penicillium paradoxum]|uniref:uncharacterized protein n=1 Tax=Penicillium paradoxum TaxID=176176 RepID=UPI002547FAF1|nr:uncharacterized protein N7457_003539 [Penicillium paradoxum]KAJ5788549.1 hypothetical protein N7457_003539 [Penicillium paradoxum]
MTRLPKSLAKACLTCRSRKIRCDTTRPRCSACETQGRECIYRVETPRQRPTRAQVDRLQQENADLRSFIAKLRSEEGTTPGPTVTEGLELHPQVSPNSNRRQSLDSLASFSDEELNVAPFISVDEAGQTNSYGPSSALHDPTKSESSLTVPSAQLLNREHMKNKLIANAALQRQNERLLFRLPDVDGVPTELALHLLDVHWTRQHHTFLLTYRPAIMRDLPKGDGPNCSRFLLNAIFACASKFSSRIDVRDDPMDPATAGRRFFRRCDELLAQESHLFRPSIPTVVGLLLLGSTFNARGDTSKGWLYTGYALRMVYDLGLHLDPKETNDDAEEVEIRRRVFWGAFVCDKIQSLYLGRPVSMNLRDSHVSREFLDTFEEHELFIPPPDSKLYTSSSLTPMYSVSTFKQLCLLSRIMTKITNHFYTVGGVRSASSATTSLQLADSALNSWKKNLPAELDFKPWSSSDLSPQPHPAPNVMNLHGIYNSLIILLHRPFISDGHLRSLATSASSWGRCTSAAKSITSISLAYKSAYGIHGAPYILSYAIYVACTIHVRNAFANAHHKEHISRLAAGLACLDEISATNSGVSKPASIIRKLAEASKLDLSSGDAMTPAFQAEIVSPADGSNGGFELDAIVGMFPSRTSVLGNGMEFPTPGQEHETALFGLVIPYDPLFGFMDATLDWPGMETSFMFPENP